MAASDSANFFALLNSSLTFALLIVTAIYAWLTHRLVRAGERQAWELTRPRIQIKIGSNQGGQLLYLELANIGMLPADNLKISIDRMVCQQIGKATDIREIPIFKNGVRAYMPGSVVKIALGVGYQYLSNETDRDVHPLNFTIIANYESSKNRITEHFHIDIENQLSQTLLNRDYIEEFAREFPDKFKKTIQEAVRQINQ